MIIEITFYGVLSFLLNVLLWKIFILGILYLLSHHKKYKLFKEEMAELIKVKSKEILASQGLDGLNQMMTFAESMNNMFKTKEEITVEREGRRLVVKIANGNDKYEYHIPYIRRPKHKAINVHMKTSKGDIKIYRHHSHLPLIVQPRHFDDVESMHVTCEDTGLYEQIHNNDSEISGKYFS